MSTHDFPYIPREPRRLPPAEHVQRRQPPMADWHTQRQRQAAERQRRRRNRTRLAAALAFLALVVLCAFYGHLLAGIDRPLAPFDRAPRGTPANP